jgi:hypothetical protein
MWLEMWFLAGAILVVIVALAFLLGTLTAGPQKVKSRRLQLARVQQTRRPPEGAGGKSLIVKIGGSEREQALIRHVDILRKRRASGAVAPGQHVVVYVQQADRHLIYYKYYRDLGNRTPRNLGWNA